MVTQSFNKIVSWVVYSIHTKQKEQRKQDVDRDFFFFKFNTEIRIRKQKVEKQNKVKLFINFISHARNIHTGSYNTHTI